MIAVRRLLLLAVFGVLGLALSGAAEARIDRPAVTPQGLKAFLLRTDEPVKHEFNRTPSFAWLPVRGAIRYEFELATSKSFTESSIVWSNANDEFVAPTTTTTAPATTTPTVETAAAKLAKLYANLRTPTVSIDLALPWITGSPYALYAHVRAITNKGPTSWSAPYGFNIRWSSVPKNLESPHPGLVRWSPVEGATAYQVWLYGAKTTFMTTTNVADARDLYTFHRTNPFFTGSIKFRVRAQRALYGEVVSGLPATTWGPWSPVYTDVQPPLSLGTLGDVAAVSDVTSNASPGLAHALTPRLRVRRRQRRPAGLQRRRTGRALPRVRGDGRGLRQHRLPRRHRRQPGVRASHDGTARSCRWTRHARVWRAATPSSTASRERP